MEMDFLLDNVPSIVREIQGSGRPGLSDFTDSLEQELSEYYRDEFKLKILTAVKETARSEAEQHDVDCRKGADCDTARAYKKALFLVAQEIDKISDDINSYGEFNRLNAGFKGETFTEEQKDDITASLDKLAQGQEIIFNEIEELKELLYVLNKKNWLEVLKGKATDKGLDAVLSIEVLREFLRMTGIDTSTLIG